jgi:hypothetical protein
MCGFPMNGLKETAMKTSQKNWKGRVAVWARALGPYAVIERVLPGGSLIAIALWAYRHWKHLGVQP